MLKKIAVFLIAGFLAFCGNSYASFEKTQKENSYNYISVYEGKVLVSDKIVDLEEDSLGNIIGVDNEGFVHVIDKQAYPRYFVGGNELLLINHQWFLKLDDNTMIPVPQN